MCWVGDLIAVRNGKIMIIARFDNIFDGVCGRSKRVGVFGFKIDLLDLGGGVYFL